MRIKIQPVIKGTELCGWSRARVLVGAACTGRGPTGGPADSCVH